MTLDANLKFIINEEIRSVKELNLQVSSKDIVIYEVVRVIERKILFLEDHIDRYFSSFSYIPLYPSINKAELIDRLHLLIEVNNIEFGNIKFQSIFKNSTRESEFFAYVIPHYYPTEYQYNNGVPVTIYKSIRDLPNAKIQHTALAETFNRLIEKEKVYEVIMLHPEGYITEGSKSNLFMIKSRDVFTAPISDVLPGITRKYILQVCKNLSLTLHEKRITCKEIFSMEALFITGTSPKVLPIRNIDNNLFDVTHPVLRLVMETFDELITNYLKCYPNISKR